MTIMEKEDNKTIKGKNNNKNTRSSKKKTVEKKNKKNSTFTYKLLSFILVILTVATLGSIIYQEIFSVFYLIPIVLVTCIIVFINVYLLNKNKLRRWIKNIFSFTAFILIVFEVLMLLFGTTTLKFLSNLTDTGYRVETYGVYVLDGSKIEELKDLEGKDIAYLEHDDNKNINEVIKRIKKKIHFQKSSSDNIKDLMDMLINEKIDGIIFDVSYEDLLKEEYTEDYSKLKLIYTEDIVDVIETIKSNKDITKEPFVVYISGIDTSGNINAKARSDVNILLGVNPQTHDILIVNTPRDYYVTIYSKNKKDKLTHAGLFGVEESLMTLGDLYDVEVDYYARINFTSFVKIVNALGGIKVNVPKKFCEQNSKRSKKEGDLICLNKGLQTLDGEQALALARHRHTLPTGDRGRGENQMLVLEAIINKAMSPKVITKYNSLISALQGRVVTNMTTNEMINFARKQVNNDEHWNFTSLSATGKDSKNVCYATKSGKAYVMEPNKESVYKIQDAFRTLMENRSLSELENES